MQIRWDHLRKQKVAVSYSGGMDSTAVLVLAKTMGLAVEAICTGADTDHPETAKYMRQICGILDIPLICKEIPGGFEFFCQCVNEEKNFIDAFNRYYMRTYHLPYRSLIHKNGYQVVLLGYRRQENQFCNGRASYQRLCPVYGWTKDRIKNFLLNRGIPLHPCYQQNKFLTGEVRESSWVDMQGYGLFWLANKEEDLHQEAIDSARWIQEYYPGKFQLVIKKFHQISNHI